MKSYLWSRYKEAKRVTKGERCPGARRRQRHRHGSAAVPALLPPQVAVRRADSGGAPVGGWQRRERLAKRAGAAAAAGGAGAGGGRGAGGGAVRVPARLHPGGFPAWVRPAAPGVRSWSQRGCGVKAPSLLVGSSAKLGAPVRPWVGPEARTLGGQEEAGVPFPSPALERG